MVSQQLIAWQKRDETEMSYLILQNKTFPSKGRGRQKIYSYLFYLFYLF